MKKYIDYSKHGTSGTDWPINYIMLRYTDILHSTAGTQADVDDIVNQVRTRAGLGVVANVTLAQLFENAGRSF